MGDYRRGGRPGGGSSLPMLRLDLAIVLLVAFFVLGMYVPSLFSAGPDGQRHAFHYTQAAIDPSLVQGIKTQVEALQSKVQAAELENNRVKMENEALRLDNQVEQSNLKSLTKSKNDVIRGLELRIKALEQSHGNGGAAGGGRQLEECIHRESAAKQTIQRLQEEKKRLEAAKGHLDLEVARLRQRVGQGEGAGDGEGEARADAAGAEGGAHGGEDDDKRPLPEAHKEQLANGGSGEAGHGEHVAEEALAVPKMLPAPKAEYVNAQWRTKLMELFEMGKESPAKLLKVLEEEDPLGVYNVHNISSFGCPSPSGRLTRPDLRQMESATAFRDEGSGFIFFQHLRKAGGTGFCDLAKRNMPHGTPPYYCMPDERGTLVTPPWTSEWLLKTMAQKKFRIAANEWDAMPRSKLGLPGAVFLTSMRDPVDRWYSQYRFEHLERRDNSQGQLAFARWYEGNVRWNMGDNYYVKTFVGTENPPDEELMAKKGPRGRPLVHGDFYWTYNKFRTAPLSWEQFESAVDMLRRFHLVLIMEWLEQSPALFERVLGWHEKPRQVLPHERQARRAIKKSPSAKEQLPEDVYNNVRERNALDVLFYHVGRRVMLEHFSCMAEE